MSTSKFNAGGLPCDGLASHPEEGKNTPTVVAPYATETVDKCQPDGPLGWYADFTLCLILFFFFFQLNAATDKSERPVVIMDGKDAKKLMNIVKK